MLRIGLTAGIADYFEAELLLRHRLLLPYFLPLCATSTHFVPRL
jgi:hypothetical protein